MYCQQKRFSYKCNLQHKKRFNFVLTEEINTVPGMNKEIIVLCYERIKYN